ncbi:AMP-binding protein [Streptomyces atratus]|uniref:AMP-binding protein n=1 Tax=Streptomyces atratus TaxID=1893 RepID=UPI0033F8B03F
MSGPKQRKGSTMTNLAHNLTRTAATHHDGPAILLDGTTVGYRTLDAHSARVAGWLAAQGVGVGDRVAILLPNIPHFAVVYYGVLRAGAVAVPMNPLLKSGEIGYAAGDCGARAILAWGAAMPEARKAAAELGIGCTDVTAEDFTTALAATEPSAEVVDRNTDDVAVLLYASGATGRPKGARLTHGNLGSNTETVARMLGLSAADTVFGGLPFFHVFGQTCGLNAAVLTGACITLLPRFDAAKALEMLSRDEVTVVEGVPTIFLGLLAAADVAGATGATDGLRFCVTGGAAMPVEVLHRFESVFGCPVLEGYGLSETSPVVMFGSLDGPRKPGSIGTPIAGVRVRLIDDEGRDVAEGAVGELAVSGPNVMAGTGTVRRPTRPPSPTAGSAPETSRGATRTASLAAEYRHGLHPLTVGETGAGAARFAGGAGRHGSFED